MTTTLYNITQSLEDMAHKAPSRRAIAFPDGRRPSGRTASGEAKYIEFNFQELNQLCDSYAHGLAEYGIHRGERTLVLIRPGVEFVATTMALGKIGAVPILIDPGMGAKAFAQCVQDTEPTTFIGIPLAQILGLVFPKAFRTVKRKVTVGKRWFWGGTTLEKLRVNHNKPFPVAQTSTEDEAAIAFTSGSTGIPKGVVYLQGMFQAMINYFKHELGISEGDIDLPGIPIFILLNPSLGVTTIIPDIDFRKLAKINPAYVVEAIHKYGVTTSLGSPTIWKQVGRYCQKNDIKLPSLKRVLMAGAPVPPWLVKDFINILDGGEVATPFGATEALPITSMSGDEILAETAKLTAQGWGICVGRPLGDVKIRVITLTDDAIAEWDEALVLPTNEVGEIVVKGPMVTRHYLNRPEKTALAKIQDADSVWHRMGDLGYFDSRGRVWMCGRKSHRVEAKESLMYPVPCEAIFNAHPKVSRTALVGLGEYGQQRPVLVVELHSGKIPSGADKQQLIEELLALGKEYEHTQPIQDILFHKSFPVDVRHNVKIQREKLAQWAEKQLQ